MFVKKFLHGMNPAAFTSFTLAGMLTACSDDSSSRHKRLLELCVLWGIYKNYSAASLTFMEMEPIETT